MLLGMTMEVTGERNEDPLEEHVESSLPKRVGYKWVHEEVRLLTWSRLFTTWPNNIYVFYWGVSQDIASLRRVSVIDSVCHGYEGDTYEFFYVYMAFFV